MFRNAMLVVGARNGQRTMSRPARKRTRARVGVTSPKLDHVHPPNLAPAPGPPRLILILRRGTTVARIASRAATPMVAETDEGEPQPSSTVAHPIRQFASRNRALAVSLGPIRLAATGWLINDGQHLTICEIATFPKVKLSPRSEPRLHQIRT